MKTLRNITVALMMMVVSFSASAQPMSVYSMRSNARFLTDRMAYTLHLSSAILDDLYCINYDYICGVNDYLDDVALGYRYDDYMEVVFARDYALRRLLTERQWELLMTYDYFYRPITFADRHWRFAIYAHDHRMDHFFFNAPRRFKEYRGGAFFGGMRAPEPGMDFRRNDGRTNAGTGFRIGNPGDMNRNNGMNRNDMNRSNDMNRNNGMNRNNNNVVNHNNGNVNNNMGGNDNADRNSNANRNNVTNRFSVNGNAQNEDRSRTTVNRNQDRNASNGNGRVTVNTRNTNTVNTRSSSTRTSGNTVQRNNTQMQRNAQMQRNNVQMQQRSNGAVNMNRSSNATRNVNTRSAGAGRAATNGRR